MNPAISSVIAGQISQQETPATANRLEIVFVDTRVADYQNLLSKFATTTGTRFETILIQSNEDGVAAVTETLARYQHVDAIHFLSHGDAGALQLGSSWVDGATARVYEQQIMKWGQAVADHGDLLFYGCDLAENQQGKDLLEMIHDWTGADVAASADLTGSAARGGDWDLEFQLGAIGTQSLAAPDWQGLLSVPYPVGVETRLNSFLSGKEYTSSPNSVAMDSNGNYVAVWTSENQDGDVRGIYAQRFDANGSPLGVEFRVNSTTAKDQTSPSIAMDASGNFVVAWQSNNQDGDGWGIFAQRFNAAGVAQGSEFRVNTVTTKDQIDPAIAMDASGDFVVTWSSKDQDGDNFGVYARRFDATGTAVGTAFRVNTYTTREQQDAAIAMDGVGDFVITWSSHDQDGNGWGIYAQRYNAGGNAQGPEFRVNTTTTKDQMDSAVGMDGSGNFVVTWTSDGQDGDKKGIFAQRFNAAGNRLGAEFQVNSTTKDDQRNATIAVDGSGASTIVWESQNQDGNGLGIYAQSFDATGTAQGGETRKARPPYHRSHSRRRIGTSRKPWS